MAWLISMFHARRRINAAQRIGLLCAASMAAVLAASCASAKPEAAQLIADGTPMIVIIGYSRQWTFPLNATGSVDVPGPLGTTKVVFGGGMVHIDFSPCPTESCVAMGAISHPGQWLVCLPNQVLVRIKGSGDDNELDSAF
jgi:hypothetical protein